MTDRIVVFSPLPPAKSGIADYMAELLPALRALRPVTMVCEKLPPELPRGSSDIISLADYERQPELSDCPCIYQIGNNADHVFVYRALRRKPGVLVQHDFNLHYLVEDATLAAGNSDAYRRVLHEEYGNAGAALADLRQAGLFSEAQKLALPLNTHLMSKARGVIVHNQWVFDRLPAKVQARSIMVPHHYAPQARHYDAMSQQDARALLDLPEDVFIVLSLGYITPPKQIQSTLAALGLLKQRGARFVFVIGGERNPGFDIDGHIRAHGLEDSVIVTGYLSEAGFFQHIVAADALVNLRYPTVGESSGTLARAQALGLPAIVHNFGPFGEIPDELVLKVPLEFGQPWALAAALENLMIDPGLRGRIGQAARRYIRSNRSVLHSAARYVELIERLYPVRRSSSNRNNAQATRADALQ